MTSLRRSFFLIVLALLGSTSVLAEDEAWVEKLRSFVQVQAELARKPGNGKFNVRSFISSTEIVARQAMQGDLEQHFGDSQGLLPDASGRTFRSYYLEAVLQSLEDLRRTPDGKYFSQFDTEAKWLGAQGRLYVLFSKALGQEKEFQFSEPSVRNRYIASIWSFSGDVLRERPSELIKALRNIGAEATDLPGTYGYYVLGISRNLLSRAATDAIAELEASGHGRESPSTEEMILYIEKHQDELRQDVSQQLIMALRSAVTRPPQRDEDQELKWKIAERTAELIQPFINSDRKLRETQFARSLVLFILDSKIHVLRKFDLEAPTRIRLERRKAEFQWEAGTPVSIEKLADEIFQDLSKVGWTPTPEVIEELRSKLEAVVAVLEKSDPHTLHPDVLRPFFPNFPGNLTSLEALVEVLRQIHQQRVEAGMMKERFSPELVKRAFVKLTEKPAPQPQSPSLQIPVAASKSGTEIVNGSGLEQPNANQLKTLRKLGVSESVRNWFTAGTPQTQLLNQLSELGLWGLAVADQISKLEKAPDLIQVVYGRLSEEARGRAKPNRAAEFFEHLAKGVSEESRPAAHECLVMFYVGDPNLETWFQRLEDLPSVSISGDEVIAQLKTFQTQNLKPHEGRQGLEIDIAKRAKEIFDWDYHIAWAILSKTKEESWANVQRHFLDVIASEFRARLEVTFEGYLGAEDPRLASMVVPELIRCVEKTPATFFRKTGPKRYVERRHPARQMTAAQLQAQVRLEGTRELLEFERNRWKSAHLYRTGNEPLPLSVEDLKGLLKPVLEGCASTEAFIRDPIATVVSSFDAMFGQLVSPEAVQEALRDVRPDGYRAGRDGSRIEDAKALVREFNARWTKQLETSRPEDVNVRTLVRQSHGALGWTSEVGTWELFQAVTEHPEQWGFLATFKSVNARPHFAPAWEKIRLKNGETIREWLHERLSGFSSFSEAFTHLQALAPNETVDAKRFYSILSELDVGASFPSREGGDLDRLGSSLSRSTRDLLLRTFDPKTDYAGLPLPLPPLRLSSGEAAFLKEFSHWWTTETTMFGVEPRDFNVLKCIRVSLAKVDAPPTYQAAFDLLKRLKPMAEGASVLPKSFRGADLSEDFEPAWRKIQVGQQPLHQWVYDRIAGFKNIEEAYQGFLAAAPSEMLSRTRFKNVLWQLYPRTDLPGNASWPVRDQIQRVLKSEGRGNSQIESDDWREGERMIVRWFVQAYFDVEGDIDIRKAMAKLGFEENLAKLMPQVDPAQGMNEGDLREVLVKLTEAIRDRNRQSSESLVSLLTQAGLFKKAEHRMLAWEFLVNGANVDEAIRSPWIEGKMDLAEAQNFVVRMVAVFLKNREKVKLPDVLKGWQPPSILTCALDCNWVRDPKLPEADLIRDVRQFAEALRNEGVPVEFVDGAKHELFASEPKRQAVLQIYLDGSLRVIARNGAVPLALAEELIHVFQLRALDQVTDGRKFAWIALQEAAKGRKTQEQWAFDFRRGIEADAGRIIKGIVEQELSVQAAIDHIRECASNLTLFKSRLVDLLMDSRNLGQFTERYAAWEELIRQSEGKKPNPALMPETRRPSRAPGIEASNSRPRDREVGRPGQGRDLGAARTTETPRDRKDRSGDRRGRR